MIIMSSRTDRNSADYHRIERAIRYLDASSPTRPTLADVASHVAGIGVTAGYEDSGNATFRIRVVAD